MPKDHAYEIDYQGVQTSAWIKSGQLPLWNLSFFMATAVLFMALDQKVCSLHFMHSKVDIDLIEQQESPVSSSLGEEKLPVWIAT